MNGFQRCQGVVAVNTALAEKICSLSPSHLRCMVGSLTRPRSSRLVPPLYGRPIVDSPIDRDGFRRLAHHSHDVQRNHWQTSDGLTSLFTIASHGAHTPHPGVFDKWPHPLFDPELQPRIGWSFGVVLGGGIPLYRSRSDPHIQGSEIR